MALLHRADLQPTKLELIDAWLPTRSWYSGPSTPSTSRLAFFRFDDPAGEVGLETLLIRPYDDGPVLQIPLTYRAAPLAGAQEWFVGNTEHSVLGRRWVYDAIGDPVYAAVLASAILGGPGQAEEMVDMGDRLERREPTMVVHGSGQPGAGAAAGGLISVSDGDPAVLVTEGVELTVVRVLARAGDHPGAERLTGTWPGQAAPAVLATAHPR